MNPFDYLIRPVLSATGRSKLTILIYHRVHPAVDPLFPRAADAGRFDEQMSWVTNALKVIPLPDAIEMLREDRLPGRTACITFDDGYADNVDVALPILRRHNLTATFFIASGFLDGGRMWNDTIIEAIRRAPGTTVDLSILGLGHCATDTPEARRAAIEAAIDKIKYFPSKTRQMHVNAVAHAVGQPLPDDMMMRSDQVRALHAAGMRIGAHTVTHPILSQLDDTEARSEIRGGREALESILGARVDLFAYPNGKPGTDYGPAHVAMAREFGFSAALSTRRGTANAASDLYQLPRFTPWGTTYRRFAIGLARNHLGHF